MSEFYEFIVKILNKAENANFQSYAAGKGYIIILWNAEKCWALLMLGNAIAKQCYCLEMLMLSNSNLKQC